MLGGYLQLNTFCLADVRATRQKCIFCLSRANSSTTLTADTQHHSDNARYASAVRLYFRILDARWNRRVKHQQDDNETQYSLKHEFETHYYKTLPLPLPLAVNIWWACALLCHGLTPTVQYILQSCSSRCFQTVPIHGVMQNSKRLLIGDGWQ